MNNHLFEDGTALTRSAWMVYLQADLDARYNRKRQRFWDLLDKGTKAITILCGGAVFGQFLGKHYYWWGAAVAGLGLMSLVYGFSDRKQAHKELAEASIQLMGRIEEKPHAWTEELVAQWRKESSLIQAKEPPCLTSLVWVCEYEQAMAIGRTDVPAVPWFRRLTAQWLNGGPASVPPAEHAPALARE